MILAEIVQLEPVSVALKFGFLAVLYLFLLWVSRSALKDLRRAPGAGWSPPAVDATGMHAASTAGLGGPLTDDGLPPQIVVERGLGLRAGDAYDLDRPLLLGRGTSADIVLEDPFSSSRHARIAPQGGVMVLEDLGSTNGTYLNGEPLQGPQPLHSGDRIRIGDTEFEYVA